MRQKLYNQKERFINISDNVGLHIFKDEVGYVDGIYNVTNKQAELIYDFVRTKDFYEILNGSNYVMVYGISTPEENAIELQAAYDAAKTMPRYIGAIPMGAVATVYKGQAYTIGGPNVTLLSKKDYTGIIEDQPVGDRENITLDIAKSIRTTVIVAPGEYNFGASAFVVNAPSIDIVSLTDNSDIIISCTEEDLDYGYKYGIKVTANDVFLKGINCKTRCFFIVDNLNNLICSNCIGGDLSFGYDGITVSGTFNNCKGGVHSFGSGCIVSGTFNYCTGDNYSFGNNGTLNATFIKCKGGNNSFGSGSTISNSKFIDCEGGQSSFGYQGTIHNVAQFIRCSGGDYSFGTNGVASGKFVDCKGGIYSFGGTLQATFDIKGDGEFIRCVGGDYSFGNCPFDDINSSAGAQKFIDCIGGNYSFGFDKDANGSYFRCIGGTNAFGAGNGSSIQGKFYYCVGGENTSMGGLKFSCVINDAPAT